MFQKNKPRKIYGVIFKKTVHLISTYVAEALTWQVTPSKLPYGTRTDPLSAAAFLLWHGSRESVA